MKKIRLAVLAAVVCTAALLTSCIKEESYEVDMAQLDVTFDTRADEEDTSGSQHQGDGIQDVMLWAFKCTLNSDGTPTKVEDTATGWRHMQNVDTYGTVSVHVPLPMCDTDKQSYVVVAVLNTDEFGNTIDFGSGTTYSDLTTGTFDASGSLFWKEYPMDGVYDSDGNLEDLVPENMPVSNWAAITITNDNTHPNHCYQLELPVYRAVAKTQLYVRKTSSAFGLAITDAKVISSKALNKGYILSKCSEQYNDVNGVTLQRGWIDENTVTPLWWSTPSDNAVATTVQLCNSTKGDIAGDEGDETDANLESEYVATPITEIDAYTWVGSAFLYENDNEVEVDADYKNVTTDNGGYYMAITYVYNKSNTPDTIVDADGNYNTDGTGNSEAITRYVPLPKIVRNHDYRVNATVDVVVNGKLKIIYEVTDWDEKTITVPEFN